MRACLHFSSKNVWSRALSVALLLSLSGIEMEIVNSCEKNNGGCSHHCEHTTNGPLCSCNHGYHLEQDRKTCVGKSSLFRPLSLFPLSLSFPALCFLLPVAICWNHPFSSVCRPQIVTSVSAGSPAAVTFVKTPRVAMSAAAELATISILPAVAVMVRVASVSTVSSLAVVHVLSVVSRTT